jgi:hypothetical protein
MSEENSNDASSGSDNGDDKPQTRITRASAAAKRTMQNNDADNVCLT